MPPITESQRIKQIEDKYNGNIRNLLYQMHWSKDMMHSQIGEQLGIPRPTLTRWFKSLNIPTQGCHRFTDKNLKSWLYKTGKLRKKPKYKGPDRRIQKTKGNVNISFFKKWSPEMAYVLGFFAADGYMYENSGGSKYINFVSTDYEILEKIKKHLSSEHKIAVKKKYNVKHKNAFLLQIGCKEIYNDLIKIGFMPNKELRLKMPKIPYKYFRHFIRGYFDGDGGVMYGYFRRGDRNNKKQFYLLTCFAYANIEFLKEISETLSKNLCTRAGYLDKKRRHLYYSKRDSIKLFYYMYKGVPKELYLERKYKKFQDAINTGA